MAYTSFLVDGWDTRANGVIVESYDWGVAVPEAQDRTSPAGAGEYPDAAYTLTVTVHGTDADDAKARLADFTRRMTPKARVTWAEDGSPTLDTYLVQVNSSADSYASDWARVTFSGTRSPFWHGPWTALTPLSVPCWGYNVVAEAIGGEVEAELRLNMIPSQATNWLAFAIGDETASVLTDDYGLASKTLSATPEVVESHSTIVVGSGQEEYLLAARVTASSAATKFYAASTATPAAGSATTVREPGVTVPAANALRGMVLGSVLVPCVDMASVRTSNTYNTPVYASGTGTAAIAVATRLPLKNLCVVASRSASAGEGIRFEDDDVFVASNPGTLRVGTSILGKTAQVYGSRHGLIPGATNCIMAAGDTPPAESPADIAFSGEYRERWLHLARS